MYQTKVSSEIKLKSGDVISAGTEVSIEPKNDSVALVHIPGREKPLGMRHTQLYLFFDEFEEVDMEMLEDAAYDSVTVSVLGDCVEPDGHDQYGFPSVLRACGLI